MAVYITAVHLEGGAGHEHIAKVRWRNSDNAQAGESTRAGMVSFINGGNSVKVEDARGSVDVGVVKPTFGEHYLRTHADGRWTDNLLALPRY